MVVRVCTDDVPFGERVDYWQHVVSDNFVRCVARIDRRDETFWGRIVSTSLGAVHYSLIEHYASSGYEICRSAKHIRQGESDDYILELQLGGESVVLGQDGREAVFDRGDFGMLDVTRPSLLACRPKSLVRAISLTFPRHLLSLRAEAVQNLTAVRINGGAGIGKLVSSFLIGLAENLDEGVPYGDDAVRLSNVLLDLLAVGLTSSVAGDSAVPPESNRSVLRTRVYSFIDRHLHDPELSPNKIAEAHHISTRYLHKLFESEESTVVEWIRLRRLEQCRRYLADPAKRCSSVGVIAARWGFRDPSYFSRLFRATYGIRPREYRMLNLEQKIPSPL
ncbi:AraC-type DNA-binding protein [Saccharopolyspora antimicrobica]|uniref:AraC-like DNA-binding protein n=1 Tax=Saccharopolyspora antimicrobica TaxID=455193 RepID=A0A1I5GR07_9PSEU|nr:helix-turn-helix domain-containing protein [Saccharopolyspora antimicrobica]RKT87415.1 AraC-like DNA-binding protein [Saccharopolyspora antimicrobica]SFO38001.1 AraC-type DNA-binding protein [Saccharopolyspora antimicrobica]